MSNILSKLINLAGNITGTLPVANGGTGLASGTSGGILGYTASGTLASSGALTANQVVIGGGAGATPSALAAGSQYQVLTMGASNPGYGAVNLAQSAAVTGVLPGANMAVATTGANGGITLTSPTQKIFLLTSYYTFTVTAANATTGATYTNNGQTFTVVYTIAGGTTLVCSATGAPAASGTLTKSAGTGDATITFASQVANGTYVTPAGVLWIRVRMVGAGAGGAGGGSAAGSNAGAGGDTTFASNTAGGGARGSWASEGGAGGTATLSTGSGLAVNGGYGGCSMGSSGSVPNFRFNGASGGNSALGGGGSGGSPGGSGSGTAGRTNTGGGGGGGENGGAGLGGGGGGSGAFIDAIISSPSATYTFNVGAGGSAGGAGTGGLAGSAGGSGMIIVEEHYY